MKFDWEPSDENIEKITESEAKFIFDHAEKLLKDIVETNALIVNRTTMLITFSVGFMLALIGFLFNRYANTKNIFDEQFIVCLLSMLYVFALCRMLVKNIQGHDYQISGGEPKKIFTDSFFTKDIPKGDRIKYFYINEIVVCQHKINSNLIINNRRWDLFNRSLWRLLYTPIVIICFYLTVKFLTFCVGIIFYYQDPF